MLALAAENSQQIHDLADLLEWIPTNIDRWSQEGRMPDELLDDLARYARRYPGSFDYTRYLLEDPPGASHPS